LRQQLSSPTTRSPGGDHFVVSSRDRFFVSLFTAEPEFPGFGDPRATTHLPNQSNELNAVCRTGVR
jgi:hypothetical protein